jgi:hypothetical protein
VAAYGEVFMAADMRLQGQAAPSFIGLLRQPGGGLLPPTRFNGASWRTVASAKT